MQTKLTPPWPLRWPPKLRISPPSAFCPLELKDIKRAPSVREVSQRIGSKEKRPERKEDREREVLGPVSRDLV